MTDTVPGDNTLEVTLAGEARPVVLTCTVGVCLALCAQPGGLQNLLGREDPAHSTVTSRLLGLDLPTMALIIRLGLNTGPSSLPKLEQQIFETGLFSVMEQLAPFLGMVKNGGRRVMEAPDDSESGGDAPGEQNPQKR
jgi:hypothetical protein